VLRDTFKDVVRKVRLFKPILKRLESTLNSLTPMVNQIRELGEQLDLPEEETKKLMEQIEEGEKLVRKCLKIRWWSSCFKASYSTKPKELDNKIVRFCQVDLQVYATRNGLITLEKVNHIANGVD